MYVPTNHHRGTHHHPSSSSGGGARQNLLDNPITYETVLMIAVVSFAMLLVGIMRCLQSCIAPDTAANEEDYYEYEYQQEYDEDARPWNLTLTADGALVDESGGKGRQYGTFWDPAHGKWYGVDG